MKGTSFSSLLRSTLNSSRYFLNCLLVSSTAEYTFELMIARLFGLLVIPLGLLARYCSLDRLYRSLFLVTSLGVSRLIIGFSI